MACGMACVATRVSGSEDLIQDGHNGLLVEPDDYEAMARALLTLLQDPERIALYGKAARETVEQGYTLQRIIDMYADIYHNLSKPKNQTIEKITTSERYPVVR